MVALAALGDRHRMFVARLHRRQSPTSRPRPPRLGEAAVTPAMLAKRTRDLQGELRRLPRRRRQGRRPGAGVLKPPPRDHTDPAYMSTLTDKQIADVIVMGGAIKGKPLMPSHPQIGGTDMDSLVAYIRTLSGTTSK